LEVWLIGRDDNFIGQILMVFGVKRRTKEKRREEYSVRRTADERECSKNTREK